MTGDPATDLLSDMKTRFNSASAGGGHMVTLTLVLCSISVPHSLCLSLVLDGTLAAIYGPFSV